MEIRKNILVVATQPQRFLDQINFANNIVNITDEIKIYFFISAEIYNYYSEIVNNLEFEIINKSFNIQSNSSKIKSFKSFIKNKLTLNRKKQISKYIYTLENTIFFTKILKKKENIFLSDLKQNYNYIYSIIKNYTIDLFLLNGDRHLGLEPVFLKVAKILNIPTIIPYMVYFAEQEDLVKTSIVNVSNSMIDSKYVKDSEERLSFHKRRNKYYYPHTIANALDKFGVLTSNPWFMGAGFSDILCLPNNYMKEHYIKNGVDLSKIKIVGDISYDQLYLNYVNRENIKEIILKKYSLDKNKKIIIVALPQLGEHNQLSWDKHWKEISFLMESLTILEKNILISLHPKMDRKSYEFIKDKYSCIILDERLSYVLPIGDMFIATFSSTILWSVLCGIKTVVIDFYGLNYKMFDFIKSIKKVNDKNKLKSTIINTLHSKVDFTEDWNSLSREKVFDGKTIKRYIDLIKEVK